MDVNYNLWIKKKKPRVWWKSDKYFVVLYKNLMAHNRILYRFATIWMKKKAIDGL